MKVGQEGFELPFIVLNPTKSCQGNTVSQVTKASANYPRLCSNRQFNTISSYSSSSELKMRELQQKFPAKLVFAVLLLLTLPQCVSSASLSVPTSSASTSTASMASASSWSSEMSTEKHLEDDMQEPID